MKKISLILIVLALVLVLSGCSCKHKNVQVRNAKEPGCVTDGYSGDSYCADCDELVSKGSAIAMTGHTEGEVRHAREASCTEEGYEGDLYCAECNEIIEPGAVIPMVAHVPGEVKYAREATCTSGGHTGAVYCTVCNTMLEPGEPTEALGHDYSEKENHVPATCLTEGQYDIHCLRCGQEWKNEKEARLAHDFTQDNICSACGYMRAGLYMDDLMVATWDQLVENGSINQEVYNGGEVYRVNSIRNQLTGKLVLPDGAYFEHDPGKCDYTSIWLPASVTGHICFSESAYLEEVKIFGKPTRIAEHAFENCVSLREFVVPDSVESIKQYAFAGCTALEKLVLSVSVTTIHSTFIDECDKVTIYYEGSEEQFAQIQKGDAALNCPIVYHYTGE